MTNVINLLKKNAQVSDYKINLTHKESYELFFVKGKLETTRRTNTCDKEITVYVNHGEFKGDSAFIIYKWLETKAVIMNDNSVKAELHNRICDIYLKKIIQESSNP